jgi:AraC-like DNA-binding protein
MYFTQLPDHGAPGFDEQAHFQRFGKQNMIFNASSRTAGCSNHVGCLSLKTVFAGEEWYAVDGRSIAVRPGQFLILNDEQSYSCRIDPGEGARTFSVFFEKHFAAAIFHELLRSDAQLIDDPFFADTSTPQFYQTLHPVESLLATRLGSLARRLDREGYDRGFVDEYLVFVLDYVLRTHRSDSRLLARIDAVRPATRHELFKRLCVARDILQTNFQAPLDLASLGRQACLSMPQLIRHFRTSFGVTPHQYLINVRLGHAAQWLKGNEMLIREIGWRCGYADVSAFCRVFKRVYGMAPEKYRMAGAAT